MEILSQAGRLAVSAPDGEHATEAEPEVARLRAQVALLESERCATPRIGWRIRSHCCRSL